LLEERDDLSVLWDIRVQPERRGNGNGKALFSKACEWSSKSHYRQLKIETQNINLAACHFYRKMGCELGTINRFAYWQDPDIPHEIMLNWYLDLKLVIIHEILRFYYSRSPNPFHCRDPKQLACESLNHKNKYNE